MAKFALCTQASTVHPLIQQVRTAKGRMLITDPEVIRSVMEPSNLSMQDRATCETDPSFLQYIPYVMVMDTIDVNLPTVFMYTRGASGGEARLHAQKSVGLGGHVDMMPDNELGLESHLKYEASRELKEEVGLDVDFAKINVVGILVDASTPVQEVHLGILMTYELSESDNFGDAETDVIVNGHFNTLHESCGAFYALENWSRLALTHALEGYDVRN